jgi:HK97 family phage prohead protease
MKEVIQVAKKDPSPWRQRETYHTDASIEYKGAGLSGDRSVTIVASTETRDRDGDILRVDGWVFSKRMPVLWGHDYSKLPIGKINKTVVRDKKLVCDVEFLPVGIYGQADCIFEMVKSGFITAASVGFIPLEYNPLPDGRGREFTKMELLELSLVTLPSNPDAEVLRTLREKGLSVAAIREVFPGEVGEFEFALENTERELEQFISALANDGKYLVSVLQKTAKLAELLRFPIAQIFPKTVEKGVEAVNAAMELINDKMRDLSNTVKLLGPVLKQLENNRMMVKKMKENR